MSRTRRNSSFAVSLTALVVMGLGYLFCFQGGSRKLEESSFYHALHEQRIESVALDSDGHVSVEVERPRRPSMLFQVLRGTFLLLFATTILLRVHDLHADRIGMEVVRRVRNRR